MTEELKRDVEEGMRKFVFVEPNKARWRMRDELKQILQNHNIQDAEIIISQAGGYDIDVDILFADGRRITCKLLHEPVEFSEIQPEAKV